MAMQIQKVVPNAISAAGGDPFTLYGTFPQGTPLIVSVGGQLCASGIPGQGSVVYSLDGTSLYAFGPALQRGAPADVKVVTAQGASVVLAKAITLLGPFYASEIFSLRSILPPSYDVGPRNFADLPEVDT